jgi:hypothetical protein
MIGQPSSPGTSLSDTERIDSYVVFPCFSLGKAPFVIGFRVLRIDFESFAIIGYRPVIIPFAGIFIAVVHKAAVVRMDAANQTAQKRQDKFYQVFPVHGKSLYRYPA